MLCTCARSVVSGKIIVNTSPGILALIDSLPVFSRRHYAKPAASPGGIVGLGKKKVGKTGPMLEKKVLPVETDTVKLVNYCCGLNINKEGEEVKLKDDSEYPDWLWTLHTGPAPPIDTLDPDTEEYWERVWAISNKRRTNLLKLKKF